MTKLWEWKVLGLGFHCFLLGSELKVEKNQSLIASVCGLDDRVLKVFWVKEDLGRFSSRSRTVTDVGAEDQRFGSKLLSSLQWQQLYSCSFLALYVMPSLLSLSLWKSTSHLLTSVRLFGNEKVKFFNRGGDITAFLHRAEAIWIYTLDTLAPKGLNEVFDICPLF